VKRPRDAIHPGDGAICADVHLVTRKGRRSGFGQLAPMRAGQKRDYDHERAKHSAANSFHVFDVIAGRSRATSANQIAISSQPNWRMFLFIRKNSFASHRVRF
jgi:hypothetical protein